ncbi:hypothetical protein Vafri_20382, partial [Volvox africanus]
GNTGGKHRSLPPKAKSSMAAARRDMETPPLYGDEQENDGDKGEEDDDVLAAATAWRSGWPAGLLNATVKALQLQSPLPGWNGAVVDGKLRDDDDESAGRTTAAAAAAAMEEGEKPKRRRGRPPGSSKRGGDGGGGVSTEIPQQQLMHWQREVKKVAEISGTSRGDTDNDFGSGGGAGGAGDASAGKEREGGKARVLSLLPGLSAPESYGMMLEDKDNTKAGCGGHGIGWRRGGAADIDVIVIDDDSDDSNAILKNSVRTAARQQQESPRPLQQQTQAPDSTAVRRVSWRRPEQEPEQQQLRGQQRVSRSGRRLRPSRRFAAEDFAGPRSSDCKREEEEEEEANGKDGRGAGKISEQRLMSDESAPRSPLPRGSSGRSDGCSSAGDSEGKEGDVLMYTRIPHNGRRGAHVADCGDGGIGKEHKEGAPSHRTPQIRPQLEVDQKAAQTQVQLTPDITVAAAIRTPPTAPKPNAHNGLHGCTPVDGGSGITHRAGASSAKGSRGRRRPSLVAAVAATFAGLLEGTKEERGDEEEVALTAVNEEMEGAEAEAVGAMQGAPEKLQLALHGARDGLNDGSVKPPAEVEEGLQVMQGLEDPMDVDGVDGGIRFVARRGRQLRRVGGCRRGSRRHPRGRPGPLGSELGTRTDEKQEAQRKGVAEQERKGRKRRLRAVLVSSDEDPEKDPEKGLGGGGGCTGSRAVVPLAAIAGDDDTDDDDMIFRPVKRIHTERKSVISVRSVGAEPARDATDGLLPMAASGCIHEASTTSCVAAIASTATGADDVAAMMTARQQDPEPQGVTKGGVKQVETTTAADALQLTPSAIEGLSPQPAEYNPSGPPSAEGPCPKVVVVAGSTAAAAAVGTTVTSAADPPAWAPAASLPISIAGRKRLAEALADPASNPNDIGHAGGLMSQGSWAEDSKVRRCAATEGQMDSTGASAATASARPPGGTAAATSTPTSCRRHQDAASAPGDAAGAAAGGAAMRLFASHAPWPAVFRPASAERQPCARLDLGSDAMSLSAGDLTAAASGHLEPTATGASGLQPGASLPQFGEQREHQHHAKGDVASPRMVAPGSVGGGVGGEEGCDTVERLRAELEAEWRERLRVELNRLREDHNRELMAKLVVARNLGRTKAEEESSKKSADLQRALTVHQGQVLELQRQLAAAVAAEEAARRALEEQQRQKEEEARAMRSEIEALRAQLLLLQQQQQQHALLGASSGSQQHAVSPSADPARASQETPRRQLAPTPQLSLVPLSAGGPAVGRAGIAVEYALHSPRETSPAPVATAAANTGNVSNQDIPHELCRKVSSPWPGSTQLSQQQQQHHHHHYHHQHQEKARHGRSTYPESSQAPLAIPLFNGLCSPGLSELGTPGIGKMVSAGGVLPAPLLHPAQPLSQAEEQQQSSASASGRAMPSLFVLSGGAAADVAPTRESILRAIVAHGSSGGISAAALVRTLEATRGTGVGGSASAAPSPYDKSGLRSRIASLLQDLVDEFEVMREGAGAANSTVDVTCEVTKYRPL